MKAENLDRLRIIPWFSIPVVCLTYFILWNRLPSELIVHWTLSGTPDTGFLVGRSQTLLLGIVSLVVILGLYTWKVKKSKENNSRGTLLRYYVAAGTLTVINLGIALYNL